jgi:hypothetical protein
MEGILTWDQVYFGLLQTEENVVLCTQEDTAVCAQELQSADEISKSENLWILVPREPLQDISDGRDGDLAEKVSYVCCSNPIYCCNILLMWSIIDRNFKRERSIRELFGTPLTYGLTCRIKVCVLRLLW